jgi:hypothetical protein
LERQARDNQEKLRKRVTFCADDSTMAWARTSLAIAEGQLARGEAILQEWRDAMENGAPTNLVIRRSVYLFSEGYSPEVCAVATLHMLFLLLLSLVWNPSLCQDRLGTN